MKKSIIAAAVTTILGFLSMGALGGALAYFVWPVVYPLAGNPDDWRGDDVWPAMIGAGVLWGAGFLAAGFVNRRLERKGWSQAIRRALYALILWASAALIWTFMITTMAFAQPASAETCDQQGLSGLRVCSDREAAAIAGRPGWMGCSGRCVIVSDVEAVSFMNRQLQVSARVDEARFLAGAGNTRDLHHLPLLAADNHLVLIDPDTFEAVGRIPLAGLADGDPALMPRFIEEAQISTDGRRFFIPSPDGPGFSAYEIVGDGLVPLAPENPVIVISPSGRYGLAVDPDGDGTFMLQDYASGTSLKTELRFDVDQAFFDVDEQYLLRRHRHMAGPRLTIYRLLNGEHVGTLAWPETGGMNVRVGLDKAGVTLTDVLPALD